MSFYIIILFCVPLVGICARENTSSLLFGDYEWPEIEVSGTAMLPCVHGPQEDGGFAARKCQERGLWHEMDFSQCRDSERIHLLQPHPLPLTLPPSLSFPLPALPYSSPLLLLLLLLSSSYSSSSFSSSYYYYSPASSL